VSACICHRLQNARITIHTWNTTSEAMLFAFLNTLRPTWTLYTNPANLKTTKHTHTHTHTHLNWASELNRTPGHYLQVFQSGHVGPLSGEGSVDIAGPIKTSVRMNGNDPIKVSANSRD
jgi:hypothetical protein